MQNDYIIKEYSITLETVTKKVYWRYYNKNIPVYYK
jgi:hypothetical protein